MSPSSLPQFPAPAHVSSQQPTQTRGGGPSPRSRRILRDLAFLLAMLFLLYELQQITAAITQGKKPLAQPWDFEVTKAGFDAVKRGGTPQEVEQSLGPPGERHPIDPVIDAMESTMWNSGRSHHPAERVWHKWFDPQNPD